MNANHTGRNVLIIFVSLFLLAGSFSGGLLVGWTIPQRSPFEVSVSPVAPTPELNTQANTPADLQTLFTPFWEAWQVVHEQFVDQPVDDHKLLQGAINGMMAALGDEHTGYMTPDEYKEATAPLDGSYEGIGAYVDVSSDLLTIISPIPNSPAEAMGLKSGDEIIKVNGQDVTTQDPSIVLKSVKGPAGTTVTLSIQRPSTNEIFDVTITRAKIELKSVESKMLENNIGYVALTTFAESTADELKSTLTALLKEKPAGLILDLRYNSGGYVDTAIEVISQFIPEGVILIEQQGSGEKINYSAISGGLATEIPLVVLVNEGSASASEITAGAIQDYGRGKLVGVTTYGKGSVQNWIPLESEQGAIRVTIARWLTPKGRQINEIGLTPDFIVELTQADFDKGKDPQLEKAVELLLQSQ
ncbi:MAG: S41 family peptidase [Chloroflexi bacterium]|nr:S41 family peptidase [Chloroflexota bacterium]